MSDPIPWQPPPEGVDTEQGPMMLPQDVYDYLMSLPPGTDITHLFEFDDSDWKITVTTT